MGIGLKKAFNGNGGIKLEFGFRFTNTDYLDDVSGNYYDWAANGGNEAQITMSGNKYRPDIYIFWLFTRWQSVLRMAIRQDLI